VKHGGSIGGRHGGCPIRIKGLHRVVLEGPDPVVARDGDDRHLVADHRVELHPRKAEGAVAEQLAELALGVGELGADRLAGTGA
jgi:hypothetical protein